MSDKRRDMDAAIAEWARAKAIPTMGHSARVAKALEHAATVEAVDWLDVLWKTAVAPCNAHLGDMDLMGFPPKDGSDCDAFVAKIGSLVEQANSGSLAERLFKSAKRDAERLASHGC